MALTRSLRELERNGLVDRSDAGQLPLRVEYTLTPTGQSLVPVLGALCTWAIEHMDEVYRARASGGATPQRQQQSAVASASTSPR